MIQLRNHCPLGSEVQKIYHYINQQQKGNDPMKKLFSILALVSILTIACNSNCQETTPAVDTTVSDSGLVGITGIVTDTTIGQK